MSASDSTNGEHGQQEQAVHGEQAPAGGHSGEGAASAMAHMISEGQRQRRHQPQTDEPGGQGS